MDSIRLFAILAIIGAASVMGGVYLGKFAPAREILTAHRFLEPAGHIKQTDVRSTLGALDASMGTVQRTVEQVLKHQKQLAAIIPKEGDGEKEPQAARDPADEFFNKKNKTLKDYADFIVNSFNRIGKETSDLSKELRN